MSLAKKKIKKSRALLNPVAWNKRNEKKERKFATLKYFTFIRLHEKKGMAGVKISGKNLGEICVLLLTNLAYTYRARGPDKAHRLNMCMLQKDSYQSLVFWLNKVM